MKRNVLHKIVSKYALNYSKYIKNDESYLKLKYWGMMGKKLDLTNPKTYNEKLQWLKLHDRREEYTTMVDKFLVKDYVSKKIGERYVIPLLGVWDNFEEINFDLLPNRFVLKCTHDSGGLIICKNKSLLNISEARKKINKSMKNNYFLEGREWPYKNVKPRIIAEVYMEDTTDKALRDYKFFAFDGEVKALFIATDREKDYVETKFDFFDRNFEHLDFRNGHPNAAVQPRKPRNYEEMVHLAQILSKGIPQVRIDFYEVNGRVYFGEITFYHWSGMVPFEPDEWDYKFGEWIKIL